MKRRLVVIALLASALQVATVDLATAQDHYLGEIRLFGFNFCPTGWVPAAGQLLPISENKDLFALFGPYYGGNATETFGLPDLRGRAPYGASAQQPMGWAYGNPLVVNLPHNQGSALALKWCVAVQGVYPSQK